MRVVDLFCGAGGMSAGLQEAGFEIAVGFDHWEPALATYRRNLGPHAQPLDLGKVEFAAAEISTFAPDLIAGGPPCQDFSSAGRRVEGRQANLTVAFAEIVDRCAPRFFLMENVPQVRRSVAYRTLRETLSEYEVAEVILDASLCGVPQKRKRFFAFGWHQPAHQGWQDSLYRYLHDGCSATPLTVKQYMQDEIDIEFYYRHPRNYSRRSVFSVHEPSPTVRGVNRPVPPNYSGNHLDSAPPSTVRALTSVERSRIQTFSTDWDWGAGNRNADVETQIGNAVPPALATFVGAAVDRAVA